jgi:hypothetical protein
LLLLIFGIYYFFILNNISNKQVDKNINSQILPEPTVDLEKKEIGTNLGSVQPEYNNFSPLFADISWQGNTINRFSKTW